MSASGARANNSAAPSAVRRSAATPVNSTFGKSSRKSRSAAATLSSPRPLITTAAPARASPLAIARPIPAVDPVTTAFLPTRSIFKTPSLHFLRGGIVWHVENHDNCLKFHNINSCEEWVARFHELNAFIAVVEAGGFSAAARTIGD